jgi:NADP-dependent 3-hydroxy acid dehydrogenase YdfG
MMKAREQEADPMKFPRLVTMLALAFGAVEETPGEEVERVYRTNIFGLLHVTRTVLPPLACQFARKKQDNVQKTLSARGRYSPRGESV